MLRLLTSSLPIPPSTFTRAPPFLPANIQLPTNSKELLLAPRLVSCSADDARRVQDGFLGCIRIVHQGR